MLLAAGDKVIYFPQQADGASILQRSKLRGIDPCGIRKANYELALCSCKHSI